MDPRRLRMGEWLAGVSGVVLLGAMFMDWYSIGGGSLGQSAWQSLSVIDLVLGLTALTAVGLAVMTAVDRSQAVPTAIASLLTPVAVVALALLLYRVISPPHVMATYGAYGPRPTGYIPQDVQREPGLWIGLAACVGVALGAMAALRDDRFPRVVREQNRVEVATLPTPPREGAGESGA
ncbi:MAG: hypothetical protein QOK25_3148 [Thermoleophilaceae bacterium]|jgi:hypothetical protein|nr:hypothetical protein [Thermoleophilaceae bacterium]